MKKVEQQTMQPTKAHDVGGKPAGGGSDSGGSDGGTAKMQISDFPNRVFEEKYAETTDGPEPEAA